MRAVAALLFMASLGCATTPSAPIRGVDAPTIRAATIARELIARGYTCTADKTEAICEAEKTYKLVLNTNDDPSRVFVVAYFNTRPPCNDGDLQARLAAANRKSDLQVACFDRDGKSTLSFGTLSILPRDGLHSDELDSFLHHFSSLAAGVIEEHKLSELLD